MKLLTTSIYQHNQNRCGMHGVPWATRGCLPGLVYVAQFGDIFKIGKTTKAIEQRMDALKKHTGIRPQPIMALSTACCTSLELSLHEQFRRKSIWWFRVQKSEYFWLDYEDLRYIAAIRWHGSAPASLAFVSHLLAKNAPLADVSEAVGHSSIATTGLYAHPTKGRDLASKLKA